MISTPITRAALGLADNQVSRRYVGERNKVAVFETTPLGSWAACINGAPLYAAVTLRTMEELGALLFALGIE